MAKNTANFILVGRSLEEVASALKDYFQHRDIGMAKLLYLRDLQNLEVYLDKFRDRSLHIAVVVEPEQLGQTIKIVQEHGETGDRVLTLSDLLFAYPHLA